MLAGVLGRLPRRRPVPRLEPNAPIGWEAPVKAPFVADGAAAGAAGVSPDVVGSDMSVFGLG